MKIIRLFGVLFFILGLISSPFSKLKAASSIELKEQHSFSLSPMLTKTIPSVVSLYVKGSQLVHQHNEFKDFFNSDDYDKNNKIRVFENLGSGVIINANKGYVITNNHVVNNANKIKVQLNDGREFDAKIIGSDSQTDLALLELISPKNLVEITIADSDNLQVGDFAVAIGNPYGLGQTATSGIISALGRSGLSIEGLENFIQTDASINQGNSGGALVNINGELIGINTAILAPNGGNVGIGFAIPSNIVKNLSEQLIKYGEVKRGTLGIKGSELTSDIAKIFDINVQQGTFVNEVVQDSAAEKAGIKAGDIIISIENKLVHNFSELRARIGTAMPGKSIKLGLLRNGKSKIALVSLYYMLDHIGEKIIFPIFEGAFFSNGKLKDGTKGIYVENIIKDSPSSMTGLRKGDTIISFNNNRTKNISQLRKMLESKPVMVILSIMRNNSNIFLLLEVS